MGLEKIGVYKGGNILLKSKINQDVNKDLLNNLSNYDYSKPMGNNTETLDLSSLGSSKNENNTSKGQIEDISKIKVSAENSADTKKKVDANYKEYADASVKNLDKTAEELDTQLSELEEKQKKLEAEINSDITPTKEAIGEEYYKSADEFTKKAIDKKTEKVEEKKKIDSQIAELSQMFYLVCQQKDIKKLECVQELSDFDSVTKKEVTDSDFTSIIEENGKYLDAYQKKVLKYWYIKEGKGKANEYIKTLEDQINRYKGLEEASKFLDKIESDPNAVEEIQDLFKASGEGISDGLSSFFENLGNYFTTNKVPSSLEYKQMYILAVLQGDSKYKELTKREELSFIYQFSQSTGNMIPTIALSTAISMASSGAATPAISEALMKSGQIVGNAAMGLSAAGGAKKQALEQGATSQEALLYGTLSGMSEGGLEYLIGGIPGLSKAGGGMIKELIQEGTEESLQEVVSAGLGSIILGEDINLEELGKQSAQAFAMGALMSATMNGGKVAVDKGIEVVVNTDTISKLYKSGNYNEIVEMINKEAGKDIKTNQKDIKLDNKSTKINDTNNKNISNTKNQFSNNIKISEKVTPLYEYNQNSVSKNSKISKSKINSQKLNENIIKICSTEFRRNIDGIDFLSTSEVGLNNLLNYYNAIKSGPNPVLLSDHINGLKNKGLKVTDFDIGSFQNSTSYSIKDFVYLSENTLKSKNSTFVHETTHFLDYFNNRNKKMYEQTSNLIEKYKQESISNEALNKCTKVKEYTQKYAIDYIEKNYKNSIELSVAEKIESEYPNLKNTDIDSYNELYNYYYNTTYNMYCNQLCKSMGATQVIGIFNSITHGKYSSLSGNHTAEYFNTNKYTASSETLALFSELYNKGMTKRLDAVFPESVRLELTNIYEGLIEKNNISSSAKQNFNSSLPNISEVMKNMSTPSYYEPDSFVVVSDFHGSNWILDKVKNHYMNEYETVFNLGDITDRGKDSVKMLLDYKNLAKNNPDRVVYVPGNHDEFIYGAFRSENPQIRESYHKMLEVNKGGQTYNELNALKQNNPMEFNELLDWLGSQPIQRIHEYNNKKYALAHAFFNYDLYKKNPNFSLKDYMETGGSLNMGKNSYYSSILWYRKSKPHDYQIDMRNLPPSDYTMVVGHTPNATNLDLGNVKVVCVDGAAVQKNSNGTYSTRKFDGGSGPEVTVSYEHNDTSPRANNTPESNAYKNALSNKDHDPKLALGYANQYGILTGNMEFVRKIKTDIYNGSKGLLNQGYVSNAIDYAKKSEDQGIINSIVKDVHTTIDNTIANKPKLALDYANQYSKSTGDIEFVRKIETYIYNGSKSLLNQGYVSNAIDYANESGNQEIINSIVKDVNTTINNAMNNNPKLALDYANQYSKSTGDISINNKVKTEISNRAKNSLKVGDASNAINYASKSGNQEIIDSVIKDMFTTINDSITNNPSLALSYASILDESTRQGIIKLGEPNLSNSIEKEIAKVTKSFVDNGDISGAIKHANNSKDLRLINETKKYISKLAYEKVDIDPKTALDYAGNVSTELKSDISMKIYEKSSTLLNDGHAHEAMDYAKRSNDDSIINSLELEANLLACELANTKPKQALDISESLTKADANYIKAEVYNHAQNYLLNSDFDKAITYAKKTKNQKFINDITEEANKLSNMKAQPVLSQQQLDSLCNFKDSNNNSSWHKLVNKIKEKLRFSSDKIHETEIMNSEGHLTTQYYYNKNNIFLTSDSKEGMKSLQSFYSNLKDYCSQDSKRSKYLSLIEENGLYLSENKEKSYHKNGNVYLSKKDIQNNSFATFFHETGHYFDFLSSKYTTGMELVNEAIAKEDFVSIESQLKIVNSTKIIRSEIKKYINNNPSIQNEISESATKEFNSIIKKDSTQYTTEELQQIYNKIWIDKYKQKVSKYTADSGLSSMSDIIDAMTNGHYQDRTKQFGHGSKYYHTKSKITREILANFSTLYLQNQTHLIDEFISKEFREKLEVAYKKIVGLN